MEHMLWEIIEESKEGQYYLESEKQFKNLHRILSNYDKDTIKEIYETWRLKVKTLIRYNEFDKLHVQNGGIVSSSDDGFYMDFANWVIAQGEQLSKEFQQQGHKAVLDYINENNISEEDYMYECMIYVFHDYI